MAGGIRTQLGVAGEQGGERRAVRHASLFWRDDRGPDAAKKTPDVEEAALHEHGGGDESFLERDVGIELLDAPFDRLGIDGSSHDRGEEVVLVPERLEDRSFSDAGGTLRGLGSSPPFRF